MSTEIYCRFTINRLLHAVLQKLAIRQLVKKLPAFNGTRRFITLHTPARYLSFSRARLIQFTQSYPMSLRSKLNILSHLGLGLLPSVFPTKILYAFFFSPMRATFPADTTTHYLITRIIYGEEYRS